MAFNSENRLAWALLLNAMVLSAAYRLVRYRGAGSAWQCLADVLLVWCGVAYVSVGIPGVLGCLVPGAVGFLNIWSITGVALVLSVALWFCVGPANPPWADVAGSEWNWGVAAPAIFAASFGAAVIYNFAVMPVLGDDALTYHAPAAVQWLQDGKINLFETWYFNPANTYSPLAGSVFIEWLMAPLHSDMLARFVQLPALVMIFALMMELCAALGASSGICALVAMAATLCRPMIGQVAYAMDDLWLAAFFLAVVVGLTKARSGDALAPWRVGVALGLMLATKYTALLTLPVLVLLVDSVRWRRGQWMVCVIAAAALAGPWYVRNLVLTGNPVYPLDVTVAGVHVFKGMFSTHAAGELRSWAGIWTVLSGASRSFTLPGDLWLALGVVWAAAMAGCWRRLRSDALVRLCLLGPLVGIGLFLLVSPYAEIRFIYPSMLLLIALGALALTTWVGQEWVARLGAGALAVAATATSFGVPNLRFLLPAALVLGVLGAVLYLIWPALRNMDARARFVAVLGGVVVVSCYFYVALRPYMRDCRAEAVPAWEEVYGRPTAEAWNDAREWLLGPTDTLAYANTYLVYPLSGPRQRRPVVYIPTRAGVRHICDLPHIAEPVDGGELTHQVMVLMQQQTDAATWLDQLDAQNVKFLYVAKNPDCAEPPEIALANANPQRLVLMRQTPAAVIYRVKAGK